MCMFSGFNPIFYNIINQAVINNHAWRAKRKEMVTAG